MLRAAADAVGEKRMKRGRVRKELEGSDMEDVGLRKGKNKIPLKANNSMYCFVCQSVSQSASQSINQSVIQPVSLSISHSFTQSVSQSGSQSLSQASS